MASDIRTLNGTLQKVIADPSYNVEAGIISKGRERTRIVLEGQMNDKRVYVATLNLLTSNNFFYHLARKVIEFVTCYSFISLKVNDKQTALASIKSLSSRLHLTRKQIFKKAAKGKLEKFILEKRGQISKKITKKKAKHFFQKAKKNYKIEDGCLIAKSNPEVSYDHETIRKLYRSIFLHAAGEKTDKLEGTFEGGYYLKLKRKKLELLDHANNDELAEGGSSHVYKVFNIASGVYNVIKCPKEDLVENILNEGRLTRQLNPNNDIPGIAERAICIFNDRPSVVYKHYYNDLFNLTAIDQYEGESSPWFQVKLEEQIFMVFQLVCGFYVLDCMGYCQVDYKTENIVWDKEASKLCLIDFGALFTLSEMSTEKRHSSLPFEKNSRPDIISSRSTFCFNDLKYFGDAIKEKNDDKFREMLQNSSVFAFGATLCEVLASLPYDLSLAGIPDLTTINFENFSELGIPGNLIDLFRKMVSENPYERPNAKDLPDLYLNALKGWKSEEMKPLIPQMEQMLRETRNKIQERQAKDKK